MLHFNGHAVELAPSKMEEAAPDLAVLCIAPMFVDQVWPHVRGFLADAHKAVGQVLHESGTLLDLQQGLLLLWVGCHEKKIVAVLTTKLTRGEGGLVCCLENFCARHEIDWRSALERHIEKYARAEGCVKMRCHGRVGWERALPEYHRVGVILEKGL